MHKLPKIAVTMGDPAGVGPELCARLLAETNVADRCSLIIYGTAKVLDAAAEKLQLQLPEHCRVEEHPLQEDVVPGKVSAACGQASFDYIDQAIAAALNGTVDAVVTNPINKEAWNAANISYPGHTELFADRCDTDRFCMMMYAPSFSVAMATTHVGYDEVPSLLTTDRIVEVIELAADSIQRIQQRPARLTCLGLNPHAGEKGLFGNREEELIIAPAIEAARAKGIQIDGPLPPDTGFLPSRRESTDCYICMYHDQALIPFKALNFDTGVNVTLGLPMIRTSVDHGTAFDIAWQGIADVSSLVAAVDLAIKSAG
ncbi:4-hydroxythreonine-4-phosphate dehydrogenase PdxA [Mariniblastus fucicola]|uniref:4-hydroxythreonine-4-phosphate dehydrogenase n=1 Tax=Mariniblastus fucicola TaxID=980251 RepID=A0A5B9P5R5_9BACT|nr:4-hydroxythreonine-4-phosphate dehydrogenase PdxA [Mariniblastus fucicola]QEG20322.1 4-hydroxythreonine-4-phosphate dehydrogenase [Mariniblastus fucicola]